MADYSFPNLFRDYWLLLKGKRFSFVMHTILRSLSNLISFVITFILGKIVDFFTHYQKGEPLTYFYYSVIFIAVLGSFQVWLRFFSKVQMQTIAAELRKEVRLSAMSKLMELDLKWHDEEETGSKIHKINDGSENIFNGIKTFSNEGIQIIMGLIGSIIFFFALNWKYALFGLAYTGIYLYGEHYFNKKLMEVKTELNKIKEKISGKLHESASNILTIKSLGLRRSFEQKTEHYEKLYYNIWKRSRDTSEKKVKSIKIFSSIAYALFILLVGYDAANGLITVGLILVFVSYFGKLRDALEEITHNITEFISIKSSLGRFMTIFGQEIIIRSDLPEIPSNWKTIEFIDVSFAYKEKLVLNNFSLVINRGDKIGIVGKSGCGKSTVVKLLLSLYQPQKGSILINGRKLGDYQHQSISKTIAVSLQESEVFNLSLKDNVAISNLQVKEKELKRAFEIAHLDSVIQKLPQGLDTPIGEKGYHLSGGERQRVGIARAVYKDCPLLVFDEATSHLDSKTESLIQASIKKRLKDKTLILIAHRLSTLRDLDKIIVLEEGSVAETGNFAELIKKKGIFYKLYHLQHK